MEKKSVIIIGAGVSGLSAGCYAQMNNFDSKIFEMHNIPGGLCTSWKRKGFTIDGCIHWLVGAGKGTHFYNIWKELGVIGNREMIFHDRFMEIKNHDGKSLIIYTDLKKLYNHLLEIAPEDKKIIRQFIKAVRIFKENELPIKKPAELFNFFDLVKLFVKHFPIMLQVIKYKNLSMKDFADKFKNPFLRENFPKIFDLPDLSNILFMYKL